jgi:hypothetical protein
MFGRKDTKPHVPAKVRAFGRARLEIAQKIQNQQDWENLWKPPMQNFPFVWGPHWKQCIEYKVDDFTAEVGFFIDVLGLPVNAFNPDYAMFTSPDQEFYFAVIPVRPGMSATPADALRIQFMVTDIFSLTEILKGRGIIFDHEPAPVTEGSAQWVASFKTPHGICLEIWGLVEMVPVESEIAPPVFGQQEVVFRDGREVENESGSFSEPFALETESHSGELRTEEDTDTIDDLEDDTEGEEEDDFTEEEAGLESIFTPRLAIPSSPQSRPRRNTSEVKQTIVAKAVKPEEPLRLLPRAAVQPQMSSDKASPKTLSTGRAFKPAPKKTQEEKDSSIWDEIPDDVQYVDLEKKPEEEYHYKPIPLSRED